MEKMINYFKSNIEDKGLAKKITTFAVLAMLIAGYHLVYVINTIVIVIKEQFGFDYFLLKAVLVPIMVLMAVRWFLKSEFKGWFIMLFWSANIFINNLYSVWLSKPWIAQDQSMIGQMEQGYSFDYLILALNFLLYGVSILVLLSKSIRDQMGVDNIQKWMPIIVAVLLFVVEILVSNLNSLL